MCIDTCGLNYKGAKVSTHWIGPCSLEGHSASEAGAEAGLKVVPADYCLEAGDLQRCSQCITD